MPCHYCCVYVHVPGRNPFSSALVFTVLDGEFLFLNIVDSILMPRSLYSLVVESGHLEILSIISVVLSGLSYNVSNNLLLRTLVHHCKYTEPVSPGWDKHSYGYHGDDGHSFCSSGTGQPYGPTFTTGDVIGCCVNLINNTCFYTKNGHSLGTEMLF